MEFLLALRQRFAHVFNVKAQVLEVAAFGRQDIYILHRKGRRDSSRVGKPFLKIVINAGIVGFRNFGNILSIVCASAFFICWSWAWSCWCSWDEFPVRKEVRASFVLLSHEVRASVRANAGQVRLVNLTMLNMPGIMPLIGGESQTVHAPAKQ